MKFDILIAVNDRKRNAHEPLPNASSFGVYNASQCIACMDGHYTQTVQWLIIFMFGDSMP